VRIASKYIADAPKLLRPDSDARRGWYGLPRVATDAAPLRSAVLTHFAQVLAPTDKALACASNSNAAGIVDSGGVVSS